MIMRIVVPLMMLVSVSSPLMAQENKEEKFGAIKLIVTLTDSGHDYARQFAELAYRSALIQLSKQPGYNSVADQYVRNEMYSIFSEAMSPSGKLAEKMVDIYSKKYTYEEVIELLKFLSSPVGQKFLGEQLFIATEMTAAADKWAKDNSPIINKRINEGLKTLVGVDKKAVPTLTVKPK